MTRSGSARSVRRFALRVLAVAGFAGAAWLLSSSAANAADASGTTPAPAHAADGSGTTPAPLSVSGIVANVGDLLDGVIASAPPATDAKAGARADAKAGVQADAQAGAQVEVQPDAMPLPVDPPPGPAIVRVADPVTRPGPVPLLLQVVSDLIQPITSVAEPILEPVLSLAVAPLQSVLAPADEVLNALPVIAPAPAPAPVEVTEVPAVVSTAHAPSTPTMYFPAIVSGIQTAGGFVAPVPGHGFGGTSPARPMPTNPFTGYLGLGGSPTTGSGTSPHGGGFAVVPGQVVASTVAVHLRPVTTPISVTRLYAENPTVSPD
jgi:hypothetical protein